MTYALLKDIVTGLLTGDNKIPGDEAVLQGLVGYALTTTATKADSLHLMTLDTTVDILRLGVGDYVVRRPVTPAQDSDILDIDEELSYGVARLVCSMVSKEKGGIHVQAADRMILDYNAKVYEVISQMREEAASEGIAATCDETFVL